MSYHHFLASFYMGWSLKYPQVDSLSLIHFIPSFRKTLPKTPNIQEHQHSLSNVLTFNTWGCNESHQHSPVATGDAVPWHRGSPVRRTWPRAPRRAAGTPCGSSTASSARPMARSGRFCGDLMEYRPILYSRIYIYIYMDI